MLQKKVMQIGWHFGVWVGAYSKEVKVIVGAQLHLDAQLHVDSQKNP